MRWDAVDFDVEMLERHMVLEVAIQTIGHLHEDHTAAAFDVFDLGLSFEEIHYLEAILARIVEQQLLLGQNRKPLLILLVRRDANVKNRA